jgi:phosphoenolpyruvate carboxykinase (ATP)
MYIPLYIISFMSDDLPMTGPILSGSTPMNAVHDLLDPVIRAQLAILGLRWANCISWNAVDAVLFQAAVERGEATVTATGGLAVTTGAHTGRAPKDKFIVRNSASATTVWWDNNQSLEQNRFDTLKQDMLAHARMKSLFVQDLIAGADETFACETRIIAEYAWQALFIRHLLIKPDTGKVFTPKLTVLCLPSFNADPARHGTRSGIVIAIDLKAGLVLIGGTHYAGEIKKSVFTVLNHMLPQKGVLPMHCSANMGGEGSSALFFGLSGTGKTTLSSDPARHLIGDDEHGWSDDGVFNFEGGCYAKAINLTAAQEPDIHAAAMRFGTVLENVAVDAVTREPDFADRTLTENTRLAYPLHAIPTASLTGKGTMPNVIIMLTADAFGVLPPIARLTKAQAIYHFLSGYTAKIAGTERGVAEPQATFSACFGAPFLPLHPSVYGEMLAQRIRRHSVSCYLVNTGWTGGGYGVGRRIPLATTRGLVSAALSGALENSEMRQDENFGFAVPVAIEGVENELLTPRATWQDKTAYDAAARTLVGLFAENIRRFDAPQVMAAE